MYRCTLVFLNETQDTKISTLVDKNKNMSKAETEAGDEGPTVTEDDIQSSRLGPAYQLRKFQQIENILIKPNLLYPGCVAY